MGVKTYSISRIINSNSETLFQIVSDFNNYSNWNTVIPSAKGKLEVGTKLELLMRMNGKIRPFAPSVISINSGKSFLLSKVLIASTIGELTHQFDFVSLPDDKTKFIQTWKGRGVLMQMLWPKISKGFSDFEFFNDDLAKYVKKQNAGNV